MNKWNKWEIKTILKKEYPLQLQKINNCPEKLNYRGNWDNKVFEKSLAVVGSRRMTRYGREVIGKFMPEIVANKQTVISGFMYGVDTEAHKTCVDLGGKTIAVLGGGLDYLAPVENDELYLNILESDGLVISEYEADFKPTLWSFPQRNRIVSGLSTTGILIIEAGLKSGSLITAKLGLTQNKQIYAIPGPINSKTSEGTNWLIKENKAKMVTEITDLLAKSNFIEQTKMFEIDLNPTETKIWRELEIESMTIDELAKKINMRVSEVATAISLMSMKNLINEESGLIYLQK